MSHIGVRCPHCLSRYQLDPTLRGKQLRCPNSQCRMVFEVRAESESSGDSSKSSPPVLNPTVTPSRVSQVSGSVGDVVPILSAEAVAPPLATPVRTDGPPRAPAEPPAAWHAAPPPVRQLPAEPTAAPAQADPGDIVEADDRGVQSEQKVEPAGAGVRELGPGAWIAPPVRESITARRSDMPAAPRPGPASKLKPLPADKASKKARRRSRWLVAALLLILAGGLTLAGWLAMTRQAENEAELFKQAVREYEEKHFADAVPLFQNLQRDFPSSENLARYRFLAELSDMREAVYFPQGGPDALPDALDRFARFLRIYEGDALITAHEADIWNTLHKLGKDLGAEAAEKKDANLLMQAHKALDEAGRLALAASARNRETLRRARVALNETKKKVDEQERHRALIQTVRDLAEKPSSQSVMLARRLVRTADREGDAELKELLNLLLKRHAAQVSYRDAAATDGMPVPPDDPGTFLFSVPLRGKASPISLGTTPRTVFAQARGVLYALDPHIGELRWARRVGIDNQFLPLRLPATPFAPELALVLSTDDNTIAAVDTATGAVAWRHQLQEPCLGQSVLVDRRVLAPSYTGRVEVIDAASGKPQGYFEVGEPLVVGGGRQEGTPFVFFPAESEAVFVLDIEKNSCARILYTGHPRGSLRGPPVLLSNPAMDVMVLRQTAGLDAVRLRTLSLNPDQKPLIFETKLPGWTWFAPFVDGERLLLATDSGALGYWGIKQQGNRDPLLFPWFKHDLTLGAGKSRSALRAQVVHADVERVWIMHDGRLHCWKNAFHPKDGPQIGPAWQEPVFLGMPLHEAQVLHDDSGATIFLLVTQDPRTSTCLASAVAASDGRVLWQRQLGVVSREPLVLAGAQIVVADGSGFFGFDATLSARTTGRFLLPLSTFHTPRILPGNDKRPTCLLTVGDPGGRTLGISVLDRDGKLASKSRQIELPAELAGGGAAAADSLVLPLANGGMEWLPLFDGPAVRGPDWRKQGADENAVGHIVPLEGGDFLISDGSRGLTRLHWPEPKASQKKASAELPARIISAPAIMPSRKGVVVGCADNSVMLLDLASLAELRTWTMPARISAGPFVYAQGICCVVDGNRLVWLDPNRKESTPAWDYSFVADVVGGPVSIANMLVVVNQAGKFQALEPETGRPLGPGYSLRANVSPAAAPLALDENMLFTPLTDGTVLLLETKRLR